MKLKEAVMSAYWSQQGDLSRTDKFHEMKQFNDLTNEELIDLISETVGDLNTTRGLGVKEEEE